MIFDSYLAICLAHIQFYFTSNISVSEGFKLGPIKELLPDISYGKIKLALAQMEKSTGQVIGEVRIFFSSMAIFYEIGPFYTFLLLCTHAYLFNVKPTIDFRSFRGGEGGEPGIIIECIHETFYDDKTQELKLVLSFCYIKKEFENRWFLI